MIEDSKNASNLQAIKNQAIICDQLKKNIENPSKFKSLFHAHFNVDTIGSKNKRETLLCKACSKGSVDVAIFLIEKGASVTVGKSLFLGAKHAVILPVLEAYARRELGLPATAELPTELEDLLTQLELSKKPVVIELFLRQVGISAVKFSSGTQSFLDAFSDNYDPENMIEIDLTKRSHAFANRHLKTALLYSRLPVTPDLETVIMKAWVNTEDPSLMFSNNRAQDIVSTISRDVANRILDLYDHKAVAVVVRGCVLCSHSEAALR